MSLWQRAHQVISTLSRRSQPASRSNQEYYFAAGLLKSLSRLAERQGQPEEQLAAELLKQALIRRKAAETNLRNWESLSQREQQVTALVCLNLTNPEIAAYLGISPETAKSHVQAALIKFGLHRRSDLRLALADWDFSAWLNQLK